jgi:hypothetical protein
MLLLVAQNIVVLAEVVNAAQLSAKVYIDNVIERVDTFII